MAFENRKFTEQEKNEISQRRLLNFREKHLRYIEPILTTRGTIDAKKHTFLIYLRRKRDEVDDYFMLVINKLVINIILERQIEEPDIIIWSMKSIEIPSESTISKEVILKLLKEALTEYRWNGYEEKINGPAKVMFDF